MSSGLLSNKTEKLFFAFIFLSFFIGTSIVYIGKFNGPPIRSDGIGYYNYLPAIFIYHDVGMNEFETYYSVQQHDSTPVTLYGLNKVEQSNNYLDKYPIGMAIMMAPYFLAGHFTTLAINQFYPDIKPDGYSSPFYHFFIAFGSSLYMLLGLIFLKRILDPYFRQKTIYITIGFLVFATNLFHYATYDSVFSHAYSFFLFAVFILLTQKWFKSQSFKHAILLGVVAGLIVIVRPTNVVFLIFFPLQGFSFKNMGTFFKNQIGLFWKYKIHILSMLMVGSLFILPQIFYWKYITNHWLVYSYVGESFDFTHPEIFNVLFSVCKGLFFWCPILLFILPGFFLMLKNKKLNQYIFPISLYLGVTTYLISCWWWWSYGGCFGHRGFVESMVVFALPLSTFYEKILEHKSKILKWIVFGTSILFLMLCMYLMIQYWRGYLPFEITTWEIFISALKNIDVVK